MPSNIKQINGRLARLQKNLKRLPNDAIEQSFEGIRIEAVERLSRQNAVWRGRLASSLRHRSEERGTTTRHVFGSRLRYAPYVEFGTGPRSIASDPRFMYASPSLGRRMVSNIERWVRGNVPTRGRTPRDMAWAIAIDMSRKGMPPSPYLEPTWWRHKPMLKQGVRNAIHRALRRSF